MALFLYKQDIFLPLVNFKERHCWNSEAMGRRIQKEIKDNAQGKIAAFALSSFIVLGTNMLACIFYHQALQNQYMILRMIRSYVDIVYPLWVVLTMSNTMGGLTAYYFFYFVFHLKYQIRLFKAYLTCASEKLDDSSFPRKIYQQKVRKMLRVIIKRHIILKT